MNIYRYEFEYKVYNSDGLEIDKGIETSKGYDEFHAENSLRIRLEEGAESDEDFFSVKLIPTFVKYTDTNKLIAEFMGHHTYESNGYIMISYSDCNERTLQDTHYHTSWDWLMPVANEIIKSRDEQNADWDLTDLKYALQTTNIELVYKAVVQFIKNQND